MKILRFSACAIALVLTGCRAVDSRSLPASILSREFVYESAPFPSCHASTIEDADGVPVAAWFGGSGEGRSDVCIYVSRQQGGSWSTPVEVANGKSEGDGPRFPCWNPVLFQAPAGPLLLFYKVGPSPARWWGMLVSSPDGGRNWSRPVRLPAGVLGPIKNKPVRLPDGSLLCPSSSEQDGWRVFMERTPDLGSTWTRSGPLNDGHELGAIQPSVLVHPGNRLQLVCRSRQGRIAECWSADGGLTWDAMKLTGLLNPNSGIDAVTLADGRHLLVHNPVAHGRTPLVISVSSDGRVWRQVLTLEDGAGEYSYPAVIQARDGLVHVTYTWKRARIRHLVVDPRRLPESPAAAGR